MPLPIRVALVLLVLAVFFAVRGAGRYSVDALLFGRSA